MVKTLESLFDSLHFEPFSRLLGGGLFSLGEAAGKGLAHISGLSAGLTMAPRLILSHEMKEMVGFL